MQAKFATVCTAIQEPLCIEALGTATLTLCIKGNKYGAWACSPGHHFPLLSLPDVLSCSVPVPKWHPTPCTPFTEEPQAMPFSHCHDHCRMFVETIGGLLRQLRECQRLHQDELGVDRYTVSRLEAGKGDIKIGTLVMLAEALGIRCALEQAIQSVIETALRMHAAPSALPPDHLGAAVKDLDKQVQHLKQLLMQQEHLRRLEGTSQTHSCPASVLKPGYVCLGSYPLDPEAA